MKTHDRRAAVYLTGIDYIPVHRNRGIDGLLKEEMDGRPVLLRVQREFETQGQAADALVKASKNKGDCLLVVVATKGELVSCKMNHDVVFINQLACHSMT